MKQSRHTVTVREIKTYFDFEQVVGDDKSLDKVVTIADTNRPGLELAGFMGYTQKKRIVILGEKEFEYIKIMPEVTQKRAFDFLTSEETPLIIISKNHDCPKLLKEVAMAKNFPIFRSPAQTSRIVINITSYLDEKLAVSECFHGVLLSINGKGVFIRGESGMGKSEIALELVRRGHQLVADDRVDCYQVHNSIIGRSPKILEGLLEIRGVGIVNIPRMFGANAVLSKTNIDVVVELQHWDPATEYDRVGIKDIVYERIMDVNIPKISLPVREGRNMSVVIESAVLNMVLKEQGYDSGKEFEHSVLEMIARNSEKIKKEKEG